MIELKATIEFKKGVSQQQADKIVKKMIESLTIEELLAIQDYVLTHTIAEVTFNAESDTNDLS